MGPQKNRASLPALPQKAPAFLETQQGTAPRVAEHPQSPSEQGLLDGPHPHPPGQEPLRLWSFGGVSSVPRYLRLWRQDRDSLLQPSDPFEKLPDISVL